MDCGLSPGEVVVAVFSTAAQNLALSTLQEGTAKLWLLGTIGKFRTF